MASRNNLYINTVSPILMKTLRQLMQEPLFNPFVLVGGTNLSLRYGHRKSDDIDLFTDAEYNSLDFNAFEDFLKSSFRYFDKPDKSGIIGFGQGYFIGESQGNCIKLDLMYTDPFFCKTEIIDNIRLAREEQIAAMKMHAIVTGGRKKDWWDIYELLEKYSLKQLLTYHKQWQPWIFNKKDDLEKLVDFSVAEKQANPLSLKNVDWDSVKLRIIDAVRFLGTD